MLVVCLPGAHQVEQAFARDVGGVLTILNSTSLHELIGWEGEYLRQFRLDPQSPTVRCAPEGFLPQRPYNPFFRFRSVFKWVGRHITDWSNPYGPDLLSQHAYFIAL